MPAVAGERVAGRRTTVAVSKLRVGNPVGKGISVSVAVVEIVSVAESAGIAELFGLQLGGPQPQYFPGAHHAGKGARLAAL